MAEYIQGKFALTQKISKDGPRPTSQTSISIGTMTHSGRHGMAFVGNRFPRFQHGSRLRGLFVPGALGFRTMKNAKIFEGSLDDADPIVVWLATRPKGRIGLLMYLLGLLVGFLVGRNF